MNTKKYKEGQEYFILCLCLCSASGIDGICVAQKAILSCKEWSAEAEFHDGSDTLSFWDVDLTYWFRTTHLHIVADNNITYNVDDGTVWII